MYSFQKTLVVIENRISELLGQACSQCLHVSEQEIVIRSSVLGLLAICSTASSSDNLLQFQAQRLLYHYPAFSRRSHILLYPLT